MNNKPDSPERSDRPESIERQEKSDSRRQELERAAADCRQAIASHPEDLAAYNNLGAILEKLGRLEEAISSYRQALAREPNLAVVRYNLGNALLGLCQFEAAIAEYQQAIALEPRYLKAHSNQGVAYRALGQDAEAMNCFNRALALDPNFPLAHFQRAFTLLRRGDLRPGFAEYEWRAKLAEWQATPGMRQGAEKSRAPRWDGSDLQGKTILLQAEQGFGDSIQFIRYVPLVAEKGGRVIVECPQPLLRLFGTVPGIAQLVPRGQALPDFDVSALLMSLPHLLGTTLETIPDRVPYLGMGPSTSSGGAWGIGVGETGGTPVLRETWGHNAESQTQNSKLKIQNSKLSPMPNAQCPMPNFKIGIVWAGSPTNPHDRQRSCSLSHFEALLDLPGAAFYSLQKGHQAAELNNLAHLGGEQSYQIEDLGKTLNDFAETAAAIAELDLIISVDTAVAHLAGAMGKPVWLLLDADPDWRWMLEREDSPWYPSMRLFRQPAAAEPAARIRNWQPVFQEVRRAIEQLIASFPGEYSSEKSDRDSTGHLTENSSKDRETAQYLQELGTIAHQKGNLPEAINYYRKVLAVEPDFFAAYNNLGAALRQSGNLEEALECYREAIALEPNHAGARNNLGNVLREQGKVEEAVTYYKEAISIDPNCTDAYHNLGSSLQELGNLEEATACYQNLLALQPQNADALNNMGNVLREQGKLEEAITYYKEAIELNPHSLEALNNLGSVLSQQNKIELALTYYERAVRLAPKDVDTRYNLSIALLLAGELGRGFAEFESRWQMKGKTFEPPRSFPQPLWDGSPLEGKTIFLHAEQGLGDSIQFIRYAPLVAERGGRVIVEAYQPLARLFETVAGIDQIVTKGNPLPEFDVYAPLMSLPRILGTTLETIPDRVPYIEGVGLCASRIALHPLSSPYTLHPTPYTLNVGIVWSANPNSPTGAKRSVPASYFLNLLEIPGIKLYGIEGQKSEPEAKNSKLTTQNLEGTITDTTPDTCRGGSRTAPTPHTLHPSPIEIIDVNDFVETAAIASQLDLIITVDTAMAHLAGAIGKQVWVLLPFAPDWRWMLGRDDSPWYPTMRLFRQTQPGDWDSVFAAVKAALVEEHGSVGGVGSVIPILYEAATNNNLLPFGLSPEPVEGSKPSAMPTDWASTPLSPNGGSVAASYRNGMRGVGDRRDRRDACPTGELGITPNSQFPMPSPQPLFERGATAQFPTCPERSRRIPHSPFPIEDLHKQGVMAYQAGRVEEAIACYQQVLNANPNYAKARNNLAVALRKQGKVQEAIAQYRQAIALQSDDLPLPELYNNLGNALQEAGNLTEAIAAYESALRERANFADAGNNLANVLKQRGDIAGAIALYRKCLQWEPNVSEAYYNLAVALEEMGELEEAIANYREAIGKQANFAPARKNLGNALRERRQFAEAIACYEEAIALNPKDAYAHWNLAISLLLVGDIRRGFAEYEWRWQTKKFVPRSFAQPLWPGLQASSSASRDFRGKTILLHAEQGFGDAIQFIRYAPLVAETGAAVIVECPQALVRLFATVAGIQEIIPKGAALPEFDYHAPLMSLPHLLATSLETIPDRVPYLGMGFEGQAGRLSYGGIEGQAGRPSYGGITLLSSFILPPSSFILKIGIVWAGNPNREQDSDRSCSLNEFLTLAELPGVVLYSLQKGAGAEELRPILYEAARNNITTLSTVRAEPVVAPSYRNGIKTLYIMSPNAPVQDLSPELEDFADTAAAISQLDLVISVDTAVAHLAGAMGKPVWVVLGYNADWRWMLDRDDSPWYPSMRLFRQTQPGDWQGVFNRIKVALEERGHGDRGTGGQEGQAGRLSYGDNAQFPIQNSKSEARNSKSEAKNSKLSPMPNPQSARKLRIGIGWQLSQTTGWGIYGTNLTLQLLRVPEYTPVLLVPPYVNSSLLNLLERSLLQPVFAKQAQLQEMMAKNPGKEIWCDFPVVSGLGRNFATPKVPRGKQNIGVIFLEDTRLSAEALERAKTYEAIVAGSTWNEKILKSNGIANCCTVQQGIDPTIFHPAPKSNLFGDRFVIFSGGKLEYRKGQDIVIAAFKEFCRRHPNALLLAAWHNFWPQYMLGLEQTGNVEGLPQVTDDKQIRIGDWLVANGLPPNSFIDLGVIANQQMARVIREADAAIFTSRCEGGTNLGAMESMACGIPTILSANTGHLDLLGESHCYPLRQQCPVRSTAQFAGVEGWGESDVAEVVETLERIYANREEASQRGLAAAQFMQDWTWAKQVHRFLSVIEGML